MIFRAGQENVAPLRIQLGTSSSNTATIIQAYAAGENSAGSASHPVLSRPTTPGTGTGSAQCLTRDGATPQSTVITNFTGAPTYPSPGSGSFSLPLFVSWRFPPGCGFVVAPSSYALFYAAASGGHYWTGGIQWEEL